MRNITLFFAALLLVSCQCKSGQFKMNPGILKMKSGSGHAYIKSVNAAVNAAYIAEKGDGYYDSQDAAGAGALIDHVTPDDSDETDGSTITTCVLPTEPPKVIKPLNDPKKHCDKDEQDPLHPVVAHNDPSKDFSEDEDYWYIKNDDGSITGVPKPKTS